jgi:hypothetical protein
MANVIGVPGSPRVLAKVQRAQDALGPALERAYLARDRVILEALDDGASLREIGRLIGMSAEGVRKCADRARSSR